MISCILIIALLPVNVFAAQPQEVSWFVRNRTGGSVEVSLTDEFGNLQFFTFEEGVSEISLMEGKYQFWASMECGNLAGTWNVNLSKILYLSCDQALPFAELNRRTQNALPICTTGEGGLYVPFYGDFFSKDYWVIVESLYFDDFTFNDWAEYIFTSEPYGVDSYFACRSDVNIFGYYFTSVPY